MAPNKVAKLLSTTNSGDGFMKVSEYGCTLNGSNHRRIGKRSGVIASEGPHNISWQWKYDGGDYTMKTTLVEADHTPVFFKLTWTRPNGTTGGQCEFQLSGPGDSETEEFCYWEANVSMNYEVGFRYPIAELPPPVVASPHSPLLGLSNDCGKMMHGSYSDVTVTADTKVFNLHKVVLSSRSDVFDRMLKADMLETNSNTISLSMDGNIAEEMIRFIYTGKVEGLEDIAAELVDAAVMYELEDLKHMCLRELVKNVDPENAAKALLIADRYSKDEENYKVSIMKYVSRNYMTVVLTDGWRELATANPELTLVVTTFYALRNS